MTSFLFAMVACFLVATGARDQRIIAHLRAGMGASSAVAVTGVLCALSTALIAAWFGSVIGRDLSRDASTMFVAIALLLAAFECAWPNTVAKPHEPTRSLGALAIVLFARQLTDASRFLVAAFAVALASPMLAGLGGGLGGAAALLIGWSMGDALEQRLPLRGIRLALSAVLFLLAFWTGLMARGLIG